MSTWTKFIEGIDYLSPEEEEQIYHSNGGELKKDEYNGTKYTIMTNGFYPYIVLEKVTETFGITKYICHFNKEKDYIPGKQDKGRKYSILRLENLAKKLIDINAKAEKLIDFALLNVLKED